MGSRPSIDSAIPELLRSISVELKEEGANLSAFPQYYTLLDERKVDVVDTASNTARSSILALEDALCPGNVSP